MELAYVVRSEKSGIQDLVPSKKKNPMGLFSRNSRDLGSNPEHGFVSWLQGECSFVIDATLEATNVDV